MHGVALLRGINVGGNNILPMAELKEIFESLGAQDVRTYIQSGNVVFRTTKSVMQKLDKELVAEIRLLKGFDIRALLLEAGQYSAIIAENPFSKLTKDETKLHVGFLAHTSRTADTEKLENLKSASEQYHLTESAFYLYAPDGIGKSKLATGAEKAIGVPMTMRNWNTVNKIHAML